jgi:hypothetical protein
VNEDDKVVENEMEKSGYSLNLDAEIVAEGEE